MSGVKVVEFQSRGPGPFGAMILADLGADVVRIARIDEVSGTGRTAAERALGDRRAHDLLARSRRSVAIDLKHPDGVSAALAGALEPLRRSAAEAPSPPLNLLGDFGGGGMLLAIGVLGALFERSRSGLGQVVDVAMVDGIALLTTLLHGMRAEGRWSDTPGTNVLDLGAPFYNVYETLDGRHITVGAGEPQFYAGLLRRLGMDDELLRLQGDPNSWPDGKARMAAVFRTRTLAEWCLLLEDTDTCVAPVLTPAEAANHPHLVDRQTFVEIDGVVQPAPAPRFSRTPSGPVRSPVAAGEHTAEVLSEYGFDPGEIEALLAGGAVGAFGSTRREGDT